jgi:hypothetical protein
MFSFKFWEVDCLFIVPGLEHMSQCSGMVVLSDAIYARVIGSVHVLCLSVWCTSIIGWFDRLENIFTKTKGHTP